MPETTSIKAKAFIAARTAGVASRSLLRIGNREVYTENLHETLTEHFPDIIHSVDSDGKIVMTNKKAESLLGYTREELLGMNVRDLYADEILDQLEQGFESLKVSGEFAVESLLKTKAGETIPVEIRSFSIYDAEGSFVRTFSILRDIRRLKELQHQLIHAERLAAIGELATGIAHDVTNPAMCIDMCVSFLEKTLQEPGGPAPGDLAKCRKWVNDIGRSTESITKLVSHLRNFARGVAEERQRVDLGKVIQDALFLVGHRVGKEGIAVSADAPEGVFFVMGQPNKLEQVFANVLTNACDAVREIERPRLTVGIESTTGEGGEGYTVTIRDTGCGIAPRDVDKVFQSFYTTKEKGQGTGLGLAIARGIVTEHRGTMELTSSKGAGTTVTIRLPRAEAPPPLTPPTLDATR